MQVEITLRSVPSMGCASVDDLVAATRDQCGRRMARQLGVELLA